MVGVNCPHCGWSMKVSKDWVDADGYHGQFTCLYGTCQVEVVVSTNLFWAYENKKISLDLRSEAHDILFSRGMIATPP